MGAEAFPIVADQISKAVAADRAAEDFAHAALHKLPYRVITDLAVHINANKLAVHQSDKTPLVKDLLYIARHHPERSWQKKALEIAGRIVEKQPSALKGGILAEIGALVNRDRELFTIPFLLQLQQASEKLLKGNTGTMEVSPPAPSITPPLFGRTAAPGLC